MTHRSPITVAEKQWRSNVELKGSANLPAPTYEVVFENGLEIMYNTFTSVTLRKQKFCDDCGEWTSYVQHDMHRGHAFHRRLCWRHLSDKAKTYMRSWYDEN